MITSMCQATYPLVEGTIAPGMTPAEQLCARAPGVVIAFAVFIIGCVLVAAALIGAIIYNYCEPLR